VYEMVVEADGLAYGTYNMEVYVKPLEKLTTLRVGYSSVLHFLLLDGLLQQQIVILSALALWTMFHMATLPHKEGALFRGG